MAIELIYISQGKPSVYLGLSTDSKPTTNVPSGSTFVETDTGKKAMYSLAGWDYIITPTYAIGDTLAEQKTHLNAVSNKITFSENVRTIEIYHSSHDWQKFTVNGVIITIPSGGYRSLIGGTPSKTVTIPAGVNCIVGRLV